MEQFASRNEALFYCQLTHSFTITHGHQWRIHQVRGFIFVHLFIKNYSEITSNLHGKVIIVISIVAKGRLCMYIYRSSPQLEVSKYRMRRQRQFYVRCHTEHTYLEWDVWGIYMRRAYAFTDAWFNMTASATTSCATLACRVLAFSTLGHLVKKQIGDSMPDVYAMKAIDHRVFNSSALRVPHLRPTAPWWPRCRH